MQQNSAVLDCHTTQNNVELQKPFPCMLRVEIVHFEKSIAGICFSFADWLQALSNGVSVFSGSTSMVSFEDVNRRYISDNSFFRSFDQDDNGDDDLDEYFHQPEKKRRLKADQVKFLEKSFETENKLEPERKVQLAKDLGLQPRQVAIWFQNRRARWKTKQLERDYDALQSSYNSLKADYENLLKDKDKLKAEVWPTNYVSSRTATWYTRLMLNLYMDATHAH